MAVDIGSSFSSDLISHRSIPKPTARTDEIQEAGAATIERGADTDRSGPPPRAPNRSGQGCTPGF